VANSASVPGLKIFLNVRLAVAFGALLGLAHGLSVLAFPGVVPASLLAFGRGVAGQSAQVLTDIPFGADQY
jgi:hypothetical protein